jgi:membrane associated rhomboid family serine protease
MATCYRHPGRETNVSCSNCGRPICPDCMTSTPVGMRCPECARQRTKVHRAPAGIGSGAAPVTVALIVINVLAYLAEMAGGGANPVEGGGSVVIDFGLFGPAVDDGEWYRIVTGGFLHAGLIHLGFNMLALYFLGYLLEPAIGPWRFIAVYFVSLLGGAFGALVLDPRELTVGASGAVFGLMSASFIVARNRGMDELATQIGFFVIINLIFTFSISNISIGGHIGGLIAGALAAMAIAVGERRGRDGRLLEWGGLVALGVAAVAGCMIAAAESVPAGFG